MRVVPSNDYRQALRAGGSGPTERRKPESPELVQNVLRPFILRRQADGDLVSAERVLGLTLKEQ